MSHELEDLTVAILAADGVERIELEEPRGALRGAGARTEVLSIHPGAIEARQSDTMPAGTIPVDRLVSDSSADDYDALLLPGGTVNPDKLRMNEDAVGFVRGFAATGKPIAAICHGPWTLVEAGVVDGRRMTSWPSIRTDLRNAGAKVVDEEVFGPVLVVAPVDSVEEGFAAVNDSRYGLQAGVFTRDLPTAFRAQRELVVGGVIVGDVPSYRADQMPYGGVKESGDGREGLRAAMDDLTEPRVMVLTGLPL